MNWNPFTWFWPGGQESKDRRAFGAFDTIYRTNWVARKAIDMPVEDMFKSWREWDKKYSKKLARAEKKLKLKQFFIQAEKYAGLYGGLIVVPFISGQDDLEKPLNLKSIKKGDLIKFVMFDRWYVGKQEINYNDPLADNYLRPTYYTLPTAGKSSLRVHYSRVTELSGLPIPIHLQRAGMLWGDSRLVPIIDTINQYTRAVDSSAKLIDEQTIDILKQENYSEAMTTEQSQELESKAFEFVRLKKALKVIFADKSTEFDRKTISMSGVSTTLEILQEDISGSIRAPVTLFFGKAKAGMSGDTNDGDIRNYKDYLATRQDQVIDDWSLVDEILVRSTLGNYPEDIAFKWNPMDVLTGTEKAKVLKDTMSAAKDAIDSGTLSPVEVRPLFSNDAYFELNESEYKKHISELQKNQNKEKEGSLNGQDKPDNL